MGILADVSEAAERAEPAALSFSQFGERFLTTAVTAERINGAVSSLEGRVIEFGPVSVAPAGLVKVSANGTIGGPDVAPRANGHPAAFDLVVPVNLDLLIDLGLDKARYHADVAVNLLLTARPVAPLAIYIDIEPPKREHVDVELRADGMRASMLQSVGKVDAEIQKAVSRYVAREISKPEMEQKRLIDIAAVLSAYRHG